MEARIPLNIPNHIALERRPPMLPRSLFLLAIHAVLALGVASAEPKAYVVEKYPVKCAPDGFATLGA